MVADRSRSAGGIFSGSTDSGLITTMTQSTNPLAVHGHIAYVEIPSTDLEASATFYSTVFGWNIRRQKRAQERQLRRPGWQSHRPLVAATQTRLSRCRRHPLHLRHRHRSNHRAEIPQLKGENVKPKHTEGDIYVATFRDPSDNLLGIWQFIP